MMPGKSPPTYGCADLQLTASQITWKIERMGHTSAGRRDAAFLENAGIVDLGLPRALP